MKFAQLLAAGALIFASSATYAQNHDHGGKSPEEKADHCKERLTKQFSLSSEDAKAIEAASLDFNMTVHKIKADETITKEVKKNQVKAAMDQRDANFKKILGEENFEQYTAAREEKKAQKEEMKNMSLEERAQKKANMLGEELGLDEEQQEKMNALTLKVAQKIEAIKNNPDFDDAKKREFINGNKADFRRALSSFVSEEQLAKFDAMAAKHKEKRQKHSVDIYNVEEK